MSKVIKGSDIEITPHEQKMYDYFYDRIYEALGKPDKENYRVSYSAYDLDKANNVLNNLDETAIEGKVQIFQKCSFFWGGHFAEDYTSKVMENPTWLDIAICANQMLLKTNNQNHVFLEGVRFLWFDYDTKVNVYTLTMGS